MQPYVVGVDECGTGAWAGPFVVCALGAPVGWEPPSGVRDSKAFSTEEGRVAVCHRILHDPSVIFYIDAPMPWEIDAAGLGVRHRESFAHAAKVVLQRVGGKDVVFDGSMNPLPFGRCEPKADATYPCVAAASIVGKVFRDKWMSRAALQFPGYGFDKSRGYGTKAHEYALSKLGPCILHRRSYAPVARLLQSSTSRTSGHPPAHN